MTCGCANKTPLMMGGKGKRRTSRRSHGGNKHNNDNAKSVKKGGETPAGTPVETQSGTQAEKPAEPPKPAENPAGTQAEKKNWFPNLFTSNPSETQPAAPPGNNSEAKTSLLGNFNFNIPKLWGGKKTKKLDKKPVKKPVQKLDKKSAKKLAKKHHNVIVVGLIHSNHCGHCIAMRPAWDEMTENLKREMGNRVLVHEVEANQMPQGLNLVRRYTSQPIEIQGGYPTLYKVVGGDVSYYNGDRDPTSMKKWYTNTNEQ